MSKASDHYDVQLPEPSDWADIEQVSNAINSVLNYLHAHEEKKSGNPHIVTKEDVKLGNVDNIRQTPESHMTDNTAHASLFEKKADKNHASEQSDYGAGSAGEYGHVKLSSATTSTAGVGSGTAATPAAVKAVKDITDKLQPEVDSIAFKKIAHKKVLWDKSTSAWIPEFTNEEKEKTIALVIYCNGGTGHLSYSGAVGGSVSIEFLASSDVYGERAEIRTTETVKAGTSEIYIPPFYELFNTTAQGVKNKVYYSYDKGILSAVNQTNSDTDIEYDLSAIEINFVAIALNE